MGVHKGNENGKNFNLGTLLGKPIQLFQEKYYKNNNRNNLIQKERINSYQKIDANQYLNMNNKIVNNQIINQNKMIYINKLNNNKNQLIYPNQNSNYNIFNNNYPQINRNNHYLYNNTLNNNQNAIIQPNKNLYNINFNNQLIDFNFNNNEIKKNPNIIPMNNNTLMNFNKTPILLNTNLYKGYNSMGYFNHQINEEYNINKNHNNLLEIIEDPYPYIKGDKKVITFMNLDKIYKKVKIPISLKKDEIYATAEKYKSNKYSKIIKLIQNNKELENDESNIDDILKGDIITILEDLDVDLSFYNSLLQKHKNRPLIYNIHFICDKGKTCFLRFPDDVTEKEVKIAGFNQFKIPYKLKEDFSVYIKMKSYLYNNIYLKDRDLPLKDLNYDINARVYFEDLRKEYDSRKANYCLNGKKIECTLKEIFHKENMIDIEFIDFGTLNQIKDLYIFSPSSKNKKGKGKIYPGEIEVEKNDERTFTEIGIRENFEFVVHIKI